MDEPRDPTADHDTDVYAWSQTQAARLRTLRDSGARLPVALDLDHIAEEIEDLGKSELRAAESFIRLILSHLAKALSDPNARARAHWATEATGWHADLLGAYTPAMRRMIDMDELWRLALRQAEKALAEHGKALRADLPARCPVALDVLVAKEFEFGEVVGERFR